MSATSISSHGSNIQIHIIRAVDLQPNVVSASLNLFVKVTIDSKKTWKSKVMKRSINPTWDESHSFAVHKSMHFAVIDSKGGDSNNLIGETTVTIAELRQLGGFDHDMETIREFPLHEGFTRVGALELGFTCSASLHPSASPHSFRPSASPRPFRRFSSSKPVGDSPSPQVSKKIGASPSDLCLGPTGEVHVQTNEVSRYVERYVDDEMEEDDWVSHILSTLRTVGVMVAVSGSSFLLGYFGFGVAAWGLLAGILGVLVAHSFHRSRERKRLFLKVQNRVVTQAHPQLESVEWVNRLFNLFYQFYHVGLNNWFLELFNSNLKIYCPASLRYLKFKEMTLGTQPPILEACLLKTDEQTGEMELDINLSWLSEFKGTLVGKLNAGGIHFSCSISDVVVSGRLRVTGKLHPTCYAYFGPMSVSFVSRPVIDAVLKPVGGIDLMEVPGISGTIKDLISGMLVEELMLWPKKIEFDLSQAADGTPEGGQAMDETESAVKQMLKVIPSAQQQYSSNVIREQDWIMACKHGPVIMRKYRAGGIISADIAENLTSPFVGRVVKGAVCMKAVRFTSTNTSIAPCLNLDSEKYSQILEAQGSCSYEEAGQTISVQVAVFLPGQYFGEMSLVCPNVFETGDCSSVGVYVVFTAVDDNTEVCALTASVKSACNEDSAFHQRLYRMVAAGLSHNLRNFMASSSMFKKDVMRKESDLRESMMEEENEESQQEDGADHGREELLQSTFDEDEGEEEGEEERDDSSLSPTLKILDSHGKRRKSFRPLTGLMNSMIGESADRHKRKSSGGLHIKVYYKAANGTYSSKKFPLSPNETDTLDDVKKLVIEASKLVVEEKKLDFYIVPQHQSAISIQVGDIWARTGMAVMIEVIRKSSDGTEGASGYLAYHKKGFVVESFRPQENDTSAQFIVHVKGMCRINSGRSVRLIALRNVKGKRFISRPLVGKKLSTNERLLYHEMIDVSEPSWNMFTNLLSDPQPLYLGKDDVTLNVGKTSAPLSFKLHPVELSSSEKEREALPIAEEEAFDPTIPLDGDTCASTAVRENPSASLVLHHEPPTDFHKKLGVSVRDFRRKSGRASMLGASSLDAAGESSIKKHGIRLPIRKKQEKKGGEQEKNANKVIELCRILGIRSGEKLKMEVHCQLNHNGGWVSGKLYLFENYFGFTGTFFSNKIKMAVRLFNLKEIKQSDRKPKVMLLFTDRADLRFRCNTPARTAHCLEQIRVQAEYAKAHNTDSSDFNVSISQYPAVTDEKVTKGLTQDDWKEILKGAKVKCYDKNSVIVGEGQVVQGLYQISYGSVRIEKFSKELGKGVVVTTLPSGEIFGEMSFLSANSIKEKSTSISSKEIAGMVMNRGNAKLQGTETTLATASVVADEDEVDVYFLPLDFLQKLFVEKGLGGRFYHYLAVSLSQRFYKTVRSTILPG